MQTYGLGDLINNRYVVEHPPLTGGMGIVYLCYDTINHIPIALKTFQQQYLGTAVVGHFLQEASIWVELGKHPHTVLCHFVSEWGYQLFIAMEMITGPQGLGADLSAWIRHHKLDLATALDFAIQTCRGMQHAQAKLPGLVHCDLKPSNILVTQDNIVKVTDFGLAKAVQTTGAGELRNISAALTSGQYTLTMANRVVGTPPYMPPEQWRGEELDIRADIYAFGCVLYEMLSGHLAFEVDFTQHSPKALYEWLQIWRELHEQTAPPELPSRLPEGVREVVYRCLAKNRDARYANFGVVETALTTLYEQVTGTSPPHLSIAGWEDWELVDRALSLETLGHRQEALTVYDQAITINPALASAWTCKGGCLLDMGRTEEALAACDQAIALNPTSVDAWNNKAASLNLLGQTQEALIAVEEALAIEPNHLGALTNKGISLAHLGRHEEALAIYNQALALDSIHLLAWLNKGASLAHLGRHEEAVAAYDQVLALDPFNIWAWTGKARCFVVMNRWDQVEQCYEKLIHLPPAQVKEWRDRLHGRLGIALSTQEDKELEESVRSLGLLLQEKKFSTLIKEGDQLVRSGKHREALSLFQNALELDAESALAWYNAGTCQMALQQLDDALQSFKEAVSLDPTLALAWNSMGVLLVSLQQYEEALQCYDKASEADPHYAKGWLNKGALFMAADLLPEALACFNKALEIDPHYTKAHQAHELCLLMLEK